MTKDEALKLALEALEDLGMKHYESTGEILFKDTFTAIKELLMSVPDGAQPEQEYHAVNAVHKGEQCYVKAQPEQPKVRTGNCLRVGVCASEGHKIQPQRTWVGLKDDDEIDELSRSMVKGDKSVNWLCRAIEAKLKEKNT